jgi:hypothetical protein
MYTFICNISIPLKQRARYFVAIFDIEKKDGSILEFLK